MKINIKPAKQDKKDAVQDFFSQPLDFSQRVEMKKLQIAGMISKAMKLIGMKRKNLAEKMGVKPSRVTAMLDGSQNLTLETIMRASEAVDLQFECTFIPKDHEIQWISYAVEQDSGSMSSYTEPVEISSSFLFNTGIASDDYALAS